MTAGPFSLRNAWSSWGARTGSGRTAGRLGEDELGHDLIWSESAAPQKLAVLLIEF